MDKDKFDQHLMDYLFDELDEVTSAAMKRKIESDAECRELVAGLRATIEVAQLPLEEPSDELEGNILTAAALASQGEPWTRKLLRSLSWAGSHAMRPQLAMAAILMLVLGSSILLLRARPGAVGVAASKDTATAAPLTTPMPEAPADDAQPEALAQADAVASTPPSAPPRQAASAGADVAADESAATPEDAERLASLDEEYDRGLANSRAGRHVEAQKNFAAVSQSKSPKAASAGLAEARAVRAHSGPGPAIAYYRRVVERFPGTAAAADAIWDLGDSYNILGDIEQAKQLWASLKDDPNYKERVANEMSKQGEVATSGGNAVASQRRAAAGPARAKAAPKPPAAAAAPPAEPKAGGSGKGKVAAPNEYDAADAY
jgi:tetratricopeptide (TPR) repeat protein